MQILPLKGIKQNIESHILHHACLCKKINWSYFFKIYIPYLSSSVHVVRRDHYLIINRLHFRKPNQRKIEAYNQVLPKVAVAVEVDPKGAAEMAPK